MDSKKEIPIVFATDNHYAIPLCVAISSMLQNKKEETYYKIYILITHSLTKENKNRLLGLKGKEKDYSIEFIKINDSLFQDVEILSYITVPAFYRLIISELLPSCSKCLYLDCDLLVLSDLQELYNIDLDDCYIAGVPDCGVRIHLENYYKVYFPKWGLPSTKDYINSGVLIMNLEQIRQDHMQEILLKQIQENFPMADQDILNKCCYGKIKILPLRYNLFKAYYQKTDWLYQAGFSKEECINAQKAPVMIHYAEELKPWNHLTIKAAGLWYEYAKIVLEEQVYDNVLKQAKELTIKREYYNLPAEFGAYNIIIFGFSPYGQEVLNYLTSMRVENIIGFCDNNVEKQGLDYQGYHVYSLQETLESFSDLYFIIASQKQYQPIYQSLIEWGIKQENIVRYIKNYKDQPYYLALSPDYYLHEVNIIMALERGIPEWTGENKDVKKELKNEKYQDIVKRYWMKDWILRTGEESL